MCIKKQQLEPDMEKLTDSKLGKQYKKTVYCPHAYLTYVQSTSCKMLAWMTHKLESRLPGEISTVSGTQTIPLQWQKAKRNKVHLESCPTLCDPWTVACEDPLPMEFSKQEYWSGLPFPSPGIRAS